MENKLVSICCITYNQEKYIETAIRSFLSQSIIEQCEILIHDDCSTDRTASIIQKYVKQYPDIIRFFPEEENQYSKGESLLPILFQYVRGKYVAICEGDDYWCDNKKLEQQVSIMESNDSLSACVHAAKLYDCRTLKFIHQKICFNTNRVIDIKQIIKKGGNFFPTASILCRSRDMVFLPKFYYDCIVEDYPLALYLSCKGPIYYINSPMSVYRQYRENAISSSLCNHKEKRIQINENLIKVLNEFSVYTHGIYQYEVDEKILECKTRIYQEHRKWKNLIRKPYQKLFLTMVIKDEIFGLIKKLLPGGYFIMKELYYKAKDLSM